MTSTNLQTEDGGARVDFTLCRSCETVAHCLRHGCIPLVDESADKPITSPEQAMRSAYWIPTWALVVVLAVLCFVYVVQRTS